MHTGVLLTYKPTYFLPQSKPPPLPSTVLLLQRLATLQQPSFSVVTALKSHSGIANINAARDSISSSSQPLPFIASRGSPGYGCHDNRGAGPVAGGFRDKLE